MNNELTPAEVIAVKLFGWTPEPNKAKEEKWFIHRQHGRARINKLTGSPNIGQSTTWPDFTDERLAWYWIRRVEDALQQKQLLMEYYDALRLASFGHCDSDVFWEFRATVPQRLEAAIRCIEEAGL